MKFTSGSFAATVLLSLAATACGGAMMAAPDQTPLLFDRLQAFPAAVVATTPAGFEKGPAPVRGTNSVYLPVKIAAVLKGDLKPGDYRLQVHERLPALLEGRDANTPRRYLLVMGIEKGSGYLGGGMVYTDLERFFLADAGLEKVARAFLEANDASPKALVKLAGGLLADKDVAASPSAGAHVHAVVARLAAKADAAQWKEIDQVALQSVIDAEGAQIRDGNAVDAPSAALVAIAERGDNPDGLKVLDERLAAPARKWLAAESAVAAQDWRPDYMRAAAMTPVIDLLGRLKDKNSKDLLLKLAKDSRWRDLRRPAVGAMEKILTPEEMKALDVPAAELPPGVRPVGGRRPPVFAPTN